MTLKAIVIRSLSKAINAVRLCRRPDHRARIDTSRRVLTTLRSFRGERILPRTIKYLRRIDPLVFEEVALSALEETGCFVWRNRRYTCDGGIDGMAWIPGVGLCPVQSKRYASHIQHTHMEAFSDLVAESGFKAGLFFHTGRSGAAVYYHLRRSGVILVSGDRLVQLVTEGKTGFIKQVLDDVEE